MVKRIVAALLTLFLLWPGPVLAAERSPRVFCLIIDQLTIYDITPQTTPNLNRLAQNGSVGLVSNRTLGSANVDDISLTIGAGNLAKSIKHPLTAYNADEIVPEAGKTAGLYQPLLTGIPNEGCQVLVPPLPEVKAAMAEENVSTRVGTLGDILRKNHKTAALLGNADTRGLISRPSAVIAMDIYGRIPEGDIGPATYRPSPGLIDVETNYDYLLREARKLSNTSDVIFIELADLARLAQADPAEPAQIEADRARILRNIDQFAGSLMKLADRPDLLLVVSPAPPQMLIDLRNTFTPVLAIGPNYQNGRLTSAATRRGGVVANTDIAPTILSFFNINAANPSLVGQPMIAEPVPDQGILSAQVQLADRSATTNRLRLPLIQGYAVLEIVLLLAALLVILRFRQYRNTMMPILYSVLVCPIVLLPLNLLALPADWHYIAVSILAVIGLTWLLIVFSRREYYLATMLAAGIMLALLNIDLFTGANMIKSSVLGYDPMAGARYYGIGNEYLGMMIGSALLFGSALYARFPGRATMGLLIVFFLGEAAVIALPNLGAQTDGVITAPIAFLTSLALLSGFRLKPKTLLVIGGIMVTAVLSLTIFDMNRPPELQTHIGRAANQIATGGWQEALTIIQRKAAMNLKLIKYTVWTRVFLVFLAGLMVLIFRPLGVMAALRDRYPVLFKGFAGIVTGAAVGLMINDSGIVTAATTAIYIVIPIVLLILQNELWDLTGS
ncbi:MAG: hypothetical protein ACM3QZ_10880 [Solirubrobacterales bacterium]